MKSSGGSIGVFDSGFGGISVLRGIIKKDPQYNYLYFGDNARAPYGNRSPKTIYKFTREGVDFLFSQGAELIILACNTASSDALRKIQQDHIPRHHKGKKVLGVIIPAAEEAVSVTTTKRIGVIGTEATVASDAFVREIKKIDQTISVFQKACPLLVPLVESGEHRSKAARLILDSYLSPLLAKKIDTLILGCTHYAMLEREIRKIIGKNIVIISEERVIPKKLADYLARHQELKTKIGRHGTVDFYTTEDSRTFSSLGGLYFGEKIVAQQVRL